MMKYFQKIDSPKLATALAVLLMTALPLVSGRSASASVNAQFTLSPSSQTYTVGDDLIINLNLDTGGNSVLAWKAAISYSTTAFTLVSVVADPSSHFNLNPGTDTASGGTIKLARYATSASSTNGTGGEQGFGFGLSLVKHLVSSLKGSLKIESRPGEGSKFSVRLPGL